MKQVIILRRDLNMRKGKMCSQAAHASVGVFVENQEDDKTKFWLETGMAKIVVGCESEQELMELREKARVEGIMSFLVKDAGKTEFNGEATFTALAVGPDEEEKVDEVTGHLKLL